MARLYEAHSLALSAAYGDLENFARGQDLALTGTPGSVGERENARGFRFYAHQSYDANGRKTERYLAGPVGDPGADAKARELRAKIAALNEAIRSLRLLGREGFSLADAKTFATVASLHNRGLFASGAMLVGAHAYGALLNQLGARAARYATRDVDIARGAGLALAEPLDRSFLEILRESGIPFVAVPQLDRKKPSSSFKERGRSFFQVDLLTPADTDAIELKVVPELQAHATALPFLAYLLGKSQDSVLLARVGCCAIRVPTPERFALHKLIVSRLRRNTAKSRNDLSQACVLVAVLAEHHPLALEDAAAALPASARRHLDAASALALPQLDSHPRAVEALRAILSAS